MVSKSFKKFGHDVQPLRYLLLSITDFLFRKEEEPNLSVCSELKRSQPMLSCDWLTQRVTPGPKLWLADSPSHHAAWAPRLIADTLLFHPRLSNGVRSTASLVPLRKVLKIGTRARTPRLLTANAKLVCEEWNWKNFCIQRNASWANVKIWVCHVNVIYRGWITAHSFRSGYI